jgi:hypothetical protein
MRELRERFDAANRLSAPDLWADIETRRPGPPPPSPRRAGTIAVALLVTALGVTVLAVALWPGSSTGPGSETSPSPTAAEPEPSSGRFQGVFGARFDFVPAEVVSSTEEELIVQAPAGETEWVVGPCRVEGGAVGADVGSTGFTAKSCGLEDGLIVMTGGLRLGERFYVVAIGRLPADGGYRVRVTLADGRQTTVDPLEGLWIVVTAAVSEPYDARPDADSRIRMVEQIDAEGNVIRVQNVSPDPYP